MKKLGHKCVHLCNIFEIKVIFEKKIKKLFILKKTSFRGNGIGTYRNPYTTRNSKM